jgi:hypothetical protein
MKPLLLAAFLATQLAAQQTQFGAEVATEEKHFNESCIHPKGGFSFGAISGCGQTLLTDHPFHIAVGSLAPGNGMATGIAVTTHYTPNEDWRLFWDFDAVASSNLSWRAGGYMTAILIRHPKVHLASASGGPSSLVVQEMPAFHLYAETTSLNHLETFGLGQNTSLASRTFFGMRQTIVGANVVWPVFQPIGLSLYGEANGRSVDLRPGDTLPITPGLGHQPGFAQLGQGVRLNPSLANGHIRLNYSLGVQEWIGGTSSFRRFTMDFGHTFPLYSHYRSLAPKSFNGPDSCLQDTNAKTCPSITRNLEGSFGLRLLYTASYTSPGDSVPFYFDPTLGGGDINGANFLPSYADYRFRGPNLLLLRASFEHSIYKWPVGVKFLVDEGRVGLTHSDLGFNHLAHSYAAGITLHAGGLPLVDLLFAWGGHEGTHNIANVNSSLLGGAARPSLY